MGLFRGVQIGQLQKRRPFSRWPKPETQVLHLLQLWTYAERLAREGVLILPTGPDQLRAVTHYQVGGKDVSRAAEVIRKVLAPMTSTA